MTPISGPILNAESHDLVIKDEELLSKLLSFIFLNAILYIEEGVCN